ncbi:MAG: Cys-tRNA(Pro) deacylase [Propionibacteriaceae bacterium]|jgi:Cys-tRNA(Pro)/Cys-tRNA(Cys) deacylase|nr:Cys-tRNA(Pro) deacylase [Propionibacteriaceae bacterium]
MSHKATPALQALDEAKVAYVRHEYEHDDRSELGFGREGAAKLGLDASRVFKTLMAEVDGHLACAVVPASGSLNLKALAAALGGKRAEMARPHDAERATGYVVGGISPLGQRRAHPTVIDDSALAFATILVSGGRRGLSVELDPRELAPVVGAAFAPIGRPDTAR